MIIASPSCPGIRILPNRSFPPVRRRSLPSHPRIPLLPPPPTSACVGDGGKAAVVKSLKEKHGYQDVLMVGDGATDMQVGREEARAGERKGGRRR